MFNDVVKLTQDLIKFKTVFTNYTEISKCAEYLENYANQNNLIYKKYSNLKTNCPIVVISNTYDKNFDVMHLGHVDVVAADENMFIPTIKGNYLYGRGAYDMKAGVATGLELLKWVKENNKKINMGVVLSFDEEVAYANSMKTFDNLNYNTNVIIDSDVGVGISGILEKNKNKVLLEIIIKKQLDDTKKTWDNKSATDILLKSINKIRKIFPEYSEKKPPKAKKIIQSKKLLNESVIEELYWSNSLSIYDTYSTTDYDTNLSTSYARLNFNLIDGMSGEDLKNIIKPLLPRNNSELNIISEFGCLNENRNNKYMKMYSNAIKKETNKPVTYVHEVRGLSNSINITKKQNTEIINHAYDGNDVHGPNERVDLKSLKQLGKIQRTFINSYIKDKLSRQNG